MEGRRDPVREKLPVGLEEPDHGFERYRRAWGDQALEAVAVDVDDSWQDKETAGVQNGTGPAPAQRCNEAIRDGHVGVDERFSDQRRAADNPQCVPVVAIDAQEEGRAGS